MTLDDRRALESAPRSPGCSASGSNDAGEALVTIPVSLTLRSLQAELAAIAASLARRVPRSRTRRTTRRSRKAIDALGQATVAALGRRRPPDDDSDAFDGAQQAASALQSISGSPAWATEAAMAIAKIAGEIAQLAIDEADAGPPADTGDPRAGERETSASPAATTTARVGAVPQGLDVRAPGVAPARRTNEGGGASRPLRIPPD